MNPKAKAAVASPMPPKVPYPQTAETAHAWVRAHGINVADLARVHQIPRSILVDVLRGRLRGYRGKAHRAAIVLGLKADPSAQQGAAA